MDPGTGLAIVSLAFQAFAGCVKCFVVISDAHNYGQDASLLRTLINYEEYRFLLWARKVGLLDEPPVLDPRLNAPIARDLMEQLQALMSTSNLKQKYKLELRPEEQTSQPFDLTEDASSSYVPSPGILSSPATAVVTASDKQRILARAKLLNAANPWPKRLWWAIMDKKKFENMSTDVRAVNDALWGLLSDMQQDETQDTLRRIMAASIQMSKDVGEIQAFQLALGATQSQPSSTAILDAAAKLRTVAIRLDFDIFNPNSERSSKMGSIGAPHLAQSGMRDRKDLIPRDLISQKLEVSHVKDASSFFGRYDGQPVYVESKIVLPKSKGPLRSRVEDLVAMLSQEQTEEFCTLRAKGLFEDHSGFKIVYQLPLSMFRTVSFESGASRPSIKLKTLNDHLSSGLKPPLEVRLSLAITLCRTLLTFHVAGWRHKGLRSSNILILPPDDNHPTDSENKIGRPILVGFNFSRPDGDKEISEDINGLSLEEEIYRHPDNLGLPSMRFARHMDMYALGTILIEIAEWWPLKSIIKKVCDISKPIEGDVEVAAVAPIRAWLIKTFITKGTAAFRMGNAFQHVLQLCLDAPKDETDSPNAVSAFHEALIRLERSTYHSH